MSLSTIGYVGLAVVSAIVICAGIRLRDPLTIVVGGAIVTIGLYNLFSL